jgi:hypothetical protein
VSAPVAVGVGCDIAVPPRAHSSNAIDGIETAGRAMKRDDNVMAMSFQMQDGQSTPEVRISRAGPSCIVKSMQLDAGGR